MKLKIITSLCLLTLVTALITGCGGETEVAKDGNLVAVHYTGTLNDGTEFDSSRDRGPLEFVVGAGQMIAGFDEAVKGMKVGEVKTVTIPPDKAYGSHHQELVFEFPKANLPEDLEVEIGLPLPLQSPEGQQFWATVIEIREDIIVLDANHELAGKELTFEIEMDRIESANTVE
jgi:peptidylprolyl isomerase